MRKRLLRWVLYSILITTIVSCQGDDVSFHRDVKPILNKSCVKCHGGVAKMGELNMLFEENLISPNPVSGKPAIVPGHPGRSEIIKRISTVDEEKRMPKEDHALADEDIATIARWIRQGARWDDHWATASIKDWSQADDGPGTIDHLIDMKLMEHGLKMKSVAKDAELIRRLSFDLTGLPPDSLLKAIYLASTGDKKMQIVEDLLDLPSYGEHLASHWLDLARYADSKGYERDSHRDIWRYRDWVISAFNEDMPMDTFALMQLAGDLLEEKNESALIATAFHRNTMTNTEGGTDDEEFRLAAVTDRLNTTMEIWHGITMACAQCHDHPFDPITQREYYESFAIFNNTLDADLTGEFPVLERCLDTDLEKLEQIKAFVERDRPQWFPEVDAENAASIHFPDLHPVDATDFTHTLLFPEGVISNWTMNVNDGTKRKFYFAFDQIPMDNLVGIDVVYGTSGDHKARLKVYVDSLVGDIAFDSTFAQTESKSGNEWVGENAWPTQRLNIKKGFSGKRALIFEIINDSGEIPDGILLIKKIGLVYDRLDFQKEWQSVQDTLVAIRDRSDKTPILREKTSLLPRTTNLLERGNRLTPGIQVKPGVPGWLGPTDRVSNRREFAEWLFDSGSDLTARTLANRVWYILFGRGLVVTLEDFGSMGEQPVNEALLDFLAFRLKYKHQWKLKPFIKDIVLSKAYRQSSVPTPEDLLVDPKNAFISRGTRKRLSAEQMRDQALALSGLLNDSLGGPSVMPYQPDNVWQTIYNDQEWELSEGSQKYRRGVYTYWKRSSPYPSMESFDATSREVCKSRRIVTNTPSQALVLLNDPTYIDAANAMGRRMLSFSKDPGQQISYAYEHIFGKAVTETVKQRLADAYNTIDLEKSPDETIGAQLDSPASAVAHILFNLDAFYVK